MLLAGVTAGAAWAGIAAVMRITVKVNEAVTTLLLNYVAVFLMLYLILGPWKDPAALGQSTSVGISDSAKLPVLAGTAVNVGVAESTFVAGPPRLLFTGNYQDVGLALDYAVAPGGQHFVMIGRTEREPIYTRVRLVLNWFTDLRRLAPVPAGNR